MKYYGDAEITGKATIDGEAEVKGKLNSTKTLIGKWTDPYAEQPDSNKSLNIIGGAKFCGNVLFSNTYSTSLNKITFDVPTTFNNNLIVNISESSKDNFKIYNDSATNDTISTYSDWVKIEADYFHFNNKNGSTKIQYNTQDDNFLINSIFKSTGWGSIYADKVKVGNSYYSMSYSNGVLTFTTSQE